MQRILLFLFLFSLLACNVEKDKPSKPVVAVSILPQKYLVSSIADTLLDVLVMVPPGASPATWEASPAQMRSLDHALAYFQIGHIGFEKAWMNRMGELNAEMVIIDLSEGLSLISMDVGHDDHTHTGIDPHTWMSPSLMEMMARKVFNELKKMLPGHDDYFRANYENLMREIKNTDVFIKKQLMAAEGKHFLIFHPSLGYFANDYGLVQHAIEYEGKEPSPLHMKNIIDIALQQNIKLIFVQKEFDQRNAAIIAEEIGGTVMQLNPLAEDWPAEMKAVSRKLSKALH